MIVDVLRNDLGRVCRPGSVRVPRLCRLERTAAVQHLVSTVTGRLAPGRDAFDLLAASFPGGSITGAPKIRAMEILEELEPVRRGPYTGRRAVARARRRPRLVDPHPDARRRRPPADAPRRRRDHLAQRPGRRVGRDRRQGRRAAPGDRRDGGRLSVASSVWLDGRLVAAAEPAPARVRPRLPARRRDLRDARAPGAASSSSSTSTSSGSTRARRPWASGCPTTTARSAAGSPTSSPPSRSPGPAPTAGPRATRRSGSRSAAGRSSAAGCSRRTMHVPPTVAIQAWPYAPPPDELLERGVRAIPSAVRRDPGSPLAGVKSTSRADYVYARLEAARAGADDALFLTIDGLPQRGDDANVWTVVGRTLATPSRSGGDPGRDDPDVAPRPRAGARPRAGRDRASGPTTSSPRTRRSCRRAWPGSSR